jgi:hypothetical protein
LVDFLIEKSKPPTSSTEQNGYLVGFWHFHVKKQEEGFAKKKLRVKDN